MMAAGGYRSAGWFSALPHRSEKDLTPERTLCRCDDQKAARKFVQMPVLRVMTHDVLLEILPADVLEGSAALQNLKQLRPSPITSTHFWFDRQVMSGRLSQCSIKRFSGFSTSRCFRERQ